MSGTDPCTGRSFMLSLVLSVINLRDESQSKPADLASESIAIQYEF